MNKAYYLTICECMCLLLQGKAEGLKIFDEISAYLPSEKEMAEAVMSLNNGELIHAEDGHYKPNSQVREFLEILGNTDSTYVINGHLSACAMECIYLYNGRGVSLRMDEHRKNYVRIEIEDLEEIVENLSENEFMPNLQDSLGKNNDISNASGPVLSFRERSLQELLKKHSVYMIIDRYKRYDGDVSKRFVIASENGLDFFVACYGNESAFGSNGTLRPYQKGILFEVFG